VTTLLDLAIYLAAFPLAFGIASLLGILHGWIESRR